MNTTLARGIRVWVFFGVVFLSVDAFGAVFMQQFTTNAVPGTIFAKNVILTNGPGFSELHLGNNDLGSDRANWYAAGSGLNVQLFGNANQYNFYDQGNVLGPTIAGTGGAFTLFYPTGPTISFPIGHILTPANNLAGILEADVVGAAFPGLIGDPNPDRETVHEGDGSRLIGLPIYPESISANMPLPALGYNNIIDYGLLTTITNLSNSVSFVVTSGMQGSGWKWYQIDGGWQATNRDANNNFIVRSSNWPSGLTPATAEIHRQGMLAGIYTSYASNDCGTIDAARPTDPGGSGDAGTPVGKIFNDVVYFNSNNFDLIKVDLCHISPDYRMLYNDFRMFGNAVNFYRATGQTNHPALLMTIFPDAIGSLGYGLDLNLFDSVNVVEDGPNYIRGDVSNLCVYANSVSVTHGGQIRRGHYAEISYINMDSGNSAQFPVLQQPTNVAMAVMSLSSILCAPVWTGSNISSHLWVLTNQYVNAIHQDSAVIPGTLVLSNSNVETWQRHLGGVNSLTQAVAIANFNQTAPGSSNVVVNWTTLGIPANTVMNVTNAWTQTLLGQFSNTFTLTVLTNSVQLLKLEPVYNPTVPNLAFMAPGPTGLGSTNEFEFRGTNSLAGTPDFNGGTNRVLYTNMKFAYSNSWLTATNTRKVNLSTRATYEVDFKFANSNAFMQVTVEDAAPGGGNGLGTTNTWICSGAGGLTMTNHYSFRVAPFGVVSLTNQGGANADISKAVLTTE